MAFRFDPLKAELVYNDVVYNENQDIVVFRGTAREFELGDEVFETLSTGVYQFTGMTINPGNTSVTVGSGNGHIVDSALNEYYELTWTDFTSVSPAAANDVTYVFIDRTNSIVTQTAKPSPTNLRDMIYLGRIIDIGGTIVGVQEEPNVVSQVVDQLYDLMKALQIFNVRGNFITANGVNLNIDKSEGVLFSAGANFVTNNKDPHEVALAAASPVTFAYVLQTAGSTQAPTTLIDPANYDLSGVITPVPGTNNRATIQRVYAFPSGAIRVQYGQNVYQSLTEALQNVSQEDYIINPNIPENGVLIGIIVVIKGATDLSDTTQARFLQASRFGQSSIGASGQSVTNLQQAYDNSISPEITLDTTRGAITLRDNATPIGANFLEVLNNALSTTYFAVNTTGITHGGGNAIFNANKIQGRDVLDSAPTDTQVLAWSTANSRWEAQDQIDTTDDTTIQGVDVSATAPTDGQVLTYVAANSRWEPAAGGGGGGSGDVTGPASSTDNAIVRFNGTTGKIIQDYTSNPPVITDTGVASFNDNSHAASERIGFGSSVSGTSSTAFGYQASAAGSCIAIGRSANASASTNNIVIGTNAQATSNQAVVIGSTSVGDTNTVSIGYATDATASGAIAIGSIAQATGLLCVALGQGANVAGARAVGVGNGNSVDSASQDSTCIGSSNTLTGASSSNVMGRLNTVTAGNALALGNQVTTAGGIAIGNSSQVGAASTMAVGISTVATGSLAQCFGYDSEATGSYSLALGYGCKAQHTYSLVIGSFNQTSSTDRQVTIGGGSLGVYLEYRFGNRDYQIAISGYTKNFSFNFPAPNGTDVNMTRDLEINAPPGTGTGTCGSILLQYYAPTTSGTTKGSKVTAFEVDNQGQSVSHRAVVKPITNVAANTTLDASHHTVTVDATGAARTITLPTAASSTGRVYVVKKKDASANGVTVQANGAELIDGANTQSLPTQYDKIMIQSDGTDWWII